MFADAVSNATLEGVGVEDDDDDDDAGPTTNPPYCSAATTMWWFIDADRRRTTNALVEFIEVIIRLGRYWYCYCPTLILFISLCGGSLDRLDINLFSWQGPLIFPVSLVE